MACVQKDIELFNGTALPFEPPAQMTFDMACALNGCSIAVKSQCSGSFYINRNGWVQATDTAMSTKGLKNCIWSA